MADPLAKSANGAERCAESSNVCGAAPPPLTMPVKDTLESPGFNGTTVPLMFDDCMPLMVKDTTAFVFPMTVFGWSCMDDEGGSWCYPTHVAMRPRHGWGTRPWVGHPAMSQAAQ